MFVLKYVDVYKRQLYYKSIQIYADDIAIITRSRTVARETYLKLKISTKEVGLSVSVDQTKMISQTRSNGSRQNLIIGKGCIEAVRDFTYLGATISEDGNEEAEIRRRITLANNSYFALIITIK